MRQPVIASLRKAAHHSMCAPAYPPGGKGTVAPAIGQFAVNFIAQHDHIGALSTSAMARKSLSSRIAPVGWDMGEHQQLGAARSALQRSAARRHGSRFSVVTSSFTHTAADRGQRPVVHTNVGEGTSTLRPRSHQAADGQINGPLPPTVTRISSAARRSAEQSARQDSSQSLRAALAVRDSAYILYALPAKRRLAFRMCPA